MKNKFSVIMIFILSISAFMNLEAGTSSAAEVTDAEKRIHKALERRTDIFCKAVLPAWFRQKEEEFDQSLKTMISDCYLGHVRLNMKGVGKKGFINKIGLSELPSALLIRETGISLDVYRPLSGRTIKDFKDGQ